MLAIGLIFGIIHYARRRHRLLHLWIAAFVVYRVTGKWLWNIGGYEYCLFWSICCLVVAMHAYHLGGIWG